MSFVDLMQNEVWSNSDIDNKVQALIRSRYSQQDELKASRLARTTNATLADMAFVAEVDDWIASCVQEGRAARADMVLLAQVLELEVYKRRLDMPPAEPVLDEQELVTNQDALDLDTTERTAAQAKLDAASPEAKQLFDLRNPVPQEILPLIPEEANGT